MDGVYLADDSGRHHPNLSSASVLHCIDTRTAVKLCGNKIFILYN
jgi:hypothetical protein